MKLFKDQACEMHLCVAVCVFGRQVPLIGPSTIDSEHLVSAHDNLSTGYCKATRVKLSTVWS